MIKKEIEKGVKGNSRKKNLLNHRTNYYTKIK